MVSVAQSVVEGEVLSRLAQGLDAGGVDAVERAYALSRELYAERTLGTGESIFDHAVGMTALLAGLGVDAETRAAALLFEAEAKKEKGESPLAKDFGPTVANLVEGMQRLVNLRLQFHGQEAAREDLGAQTEVLRKMLLAMAEDIRVVLLRLASRTQTLRYFTQHEAPQRAEMAQETLEVYAPLANRLGVWQLKWEMEDLAFRFTQPEGYKRIAKMLDERRVGRENFIAESIERLKRELKAQGVEAEVYGRPKHIYSIWNKMHGKDLDFSEVYDVRALRVIVDDEKDCYTALGVVHQMWQPIPKEFDDYISKPKGNFYRSLHTAVLAEDGRALEVQIRTHEMHKHAELGVAAHWRYKEGAARSEGAYDDKIALLRQLLSWRDEITDSSEWVTQFKRAALDDTIYVLTPQGKVLDLPHGATPLDFAYRLHTDLGHRCRGARVDGQLVPLDTPLANGQRVEIVAAKSGGPSRDWLLPSLGFIATPRARQKVRQWFAAQEEAELLTQGRAALMRELQREGQTQANIEELAQKLGLRSTNDLYLAAGRGDVGPRAIRTALHGETAEAEPQEIQTKRSKASSSAGQVLIVGVDKLMTQLGRCCKPVPPDAISGFVTRGKGVSIHRVECTNFRNMAARNPERVIEATWGGADDDNLYPVDLMVDASDRQGLLRDISEVLSREKINVTAVRTLSTNGRARMGFTVELRGLSQLQRTLNLIGEISGVDAVMRQ